MVDSFFLFIKKIKTKKKMQLATPLTLKINSFF